MAIDVLTAQGVKTSIAMPFIWSQDNPVASKEGSFFSFAFNAKTIVFCLQVDTPLNATPSLRCYNPYRFTTKAQITPTIDSARLTGTSQNKQRGAFCYPLNIA